MTVVEEGGRRRPTLHPQLAAWEILRASLVGDGGPVVAKCSGCGQPMTADQPLPAMAWVVEGPDGRFTVEDSAIRGNDGGSLTVDQVDGILRAAYREPFRPAQTLFESVLMSIMAIPVLLWAFALFIVLWFLYNTLGGTVGF